MGTQNNQHDGLSEELEKTESELIQKIGDKISQYVEDGLDKDIEKIDDAAQVMSEKADDFKKISESLDIVFQTSGGLKESVDLAMESALKLKESLTDTVNAMTGKELAIVGSINEAMASLQKFSSDLDKANGAAMELSKLREEIDKDYITVGKTMDAWNESSENSCKALDKMKTSLIKSYQSFEQTIGSSLENIKLYTDQYSELINHADGKFDNILAEIRQITERLDVAENKMKKQNFVLMAIGVIIIILQMIGFFV